MVRHWGASSGSDRQSTCNQLVGTRSAFFSSYLNVPPLLNLIPTILSATALTSGEPLAHSFKLLHYTVSIHDTGGHVMDTQDDNIVSKYDVLLRLSNLQDVPPRVQMCP